jgi:Flp pilus assembly protein TadG
MVALMAVVLFGLAAFAVDFGQAYAAKRQMQNGSDSAALAAAQVYATYPGTCYDLVNNGAARTAAQQAANDFREDNRAGSSADAGIRPIKPACAPDGSGTLWVTVGSQGDTDAVFAPVIGGSNKITTGRTATAAVEVSPNGGDGLRPVAVCAGDLPSGDKVTGIPVRVNAPGNGTAAPNGCPALASGNWWTLDCPEDRIGGNPTLEAEIKNGCQDPVGIVPGQDPANPAPALLAACPSAPLHSPDCLSGDPGQMDSGHIEDSWKYLIDNRTQIVLPSFLASTVRGNGTGAIFPVHKLAGMVVCGYHFGKQTNNHYEPKTNPACANSTVGVMADGTTDNYLVVVFTQIMTSGDYTANHCALGTECDGGVRRVRLTQ